MSVLTQGKPTIGEKRHPGHEQEAFLLVIFKDWGKEKATINVVGESDNQMKSHILLDKIPILSSLTRLNSKS